MKYTLIASFSLILVSCASLPPTPGILYSDVQYAQQSTSNQTGNRIGEACSTSILGLVAMGDSTIEAARRNGGITMISSVDRSHKSFLGFGYAKNCTIVRGR